MNLNRNVRSSPRFILLAQFVVGVVLAWGVGYAWLGSYAPLVAAGILTTVVHVTSWRIRGQVRGFWLTALGLCSALSKIDPELSTSAMGDLRLPVIVGGSLLAILYGFSVEEPDSIRNLFARRTTAP
jgi:hypothetical protein